MQNTVWLNEFVMDIFFLELHIFIVIINYFVEFSFCHASYLILTYEVDSIQVRAYISWWS